MFVWNVIAIIFQLSKDRPVRATLNAQIERTAVSLCAIARVSMYSLMAYVKVSYRPIVDQLHTIISDKNWVKLHVLCGGC